MVLKDLHSQKTGIEVTICQGYVRVQQHEAFGQSQEKYDGEGRHQHRDRDITESLEYVCTVNSSRLGEIGRNVVQTCRINQHHVSGHLPGNEN